MNLSNKLAENPIFGIVAKASENIDVKAYVVGGYVRDLLLERKSKDIDFVCVGKGIELAEKVASMLPKSQVTVFRNFGTAMVNWPGGEIEFVGARKESYARESRKPIVEDGTLDEDLTRRDFTINAMAISLNKENFGLLIDKFNGLNDLSEKTIKTPCDPDITFSDDPLRMMRAIRFANQLDFDIEHDTFNSIKKNKERIEIVSAERITEELNKIILCQTPSYGFKLLLHAGILKIIFPELVELQGVEEINGLAHKDNFFHTLQVLDNVIKLEADLWLRWAALLHDIAKPATKRFDSKAGWTFHSHEEKGARMVPKIFARMRLPLDHKMKFVQKLVRLHLRPIALVKETTTESAIRRLLFEAGEDVNALMRLCRADITTKNADKVKKYIQNFTRVEQKMLEVEEKDKIRSFQPIITGDVIMACFDLKPSKTVGDLKVELREALLDGIIQNQLDEAYHFLLNVAKKQGLEAKMSIEQVAILVEELKQKESEEEVQNNDNQ